MKLILAVAALGLVAGCSHGHQRFGAEDIVLLKRQGLADDEVLRRVRGHDGVLVLTAEDAASLRGAGMSENYINALLSLAADQDSRHPEARRERAPEHKH